MIMTMMTMVSTMMMMMVTMMMMMMMMMMNIKTLCESFRGPASHWVVLGHQSDGGFDDYHNHYAYMHLMKKHIVWIQNK